MNNTLQAKRLFSFGGGVQSVAALVLAARREIPYRTFLFSNVGDDSENPDTIEYTEKHSKPYASKLGLRLIDTSWVGMKGIKRGISRTLYGDLLYGSQKDIPIPMRLIAGGFGNRKCTLRYKIEPIQRWTAARGVTPENPAILGLGISLDEYHRMADSKTPWHINHYPLIDLRITRDDCKQIIQEAGLPIPPKSSCWFCPFKNLQDWQELQATKPELFAKAVELERILNERREKLGKDKAYFAPTFTPLSSLPSVADISNMFDGCESGHRWT